jgi:hypothetical protein
MPAEAIERLAVVESQQGHYADDVQELKREMVLLRQQLDSFVRDATPVLNAFKAQQEAKTRVLNAVAVKLAEWSIVGLLVYLANGALDRITTDVAHRVESQENKR